MSPRRGVPMPGSLPRGAPPRSSRGPSGGARWPPRDPPEAPRPLETPPTARRPPPVAGEWTRRERAAPVVRLRQAPYGRDPELRRLALPANELRHRQHVHLTLDQIIEEVRRLPREQVADLVNRLTLELHQAIDPSLEEAWKRETRRRVSEIESGSVQGVPGDEVSARVRKIVGR